MCLPWFFFLQHVLLLTRHKPHVFFLHALSLLHLGIHPKIQLTFFKNKNIQTLKNKQNKQTNQWGRQTSSFFHLCPLLFNSSLSLCFILYPSPCLLLPIDLCFFLLFPSASALHLYERIRFSLFIFFFFIYFWYLFSVLISVQPPCHSKRTHIFSPYIPYFYILHFIPILRLFRILDIFFYPFISTCSLFKVLLHFFFRLSSLLSSSCLCN